jgi:hypothetical protein
VFFQGAKVVSELHSTGPVSAKIVSVGERVMIEGSDAEYVVLSVNHETGRMELLRLNTGRIEQDVPVSRVQKKLVHRTRPVVRPG